MHNGIVIIWQYAYGDPILIVFSKGGGGGGGALRHVYHKVHLGNHRTNLSQRELKTLARKEGVKPMQPL